jgi:hypothetical protein
MTKIVFIGQQPNEYADENQPALPVRPNSSGARLVKLMGITEEAFRYHFTLVNVSPHHDPEGFNPTYNIAAALNLLPLLEDRRVVLLGPAIANSFCINRDAYQFNKWFDYPGEMNALFSVIPHPSGMNRLYNDPVVVEEVREFLNYCWETRTGEN